MRIKTLFAAVLLMQFCDATTAGTDQNKREIYGMVQSTSNYGADGTSPLRVPYGTDEIEFSLKKIAAEKIDKLAPNKQIRVFSPGKSKTTGTEASYVFQLRKRTEEEKKRSGEEGKGLQVVFLKATKETDFFKDIDEIIKAGVYYRDASGKKVKLPDTRNKQTGDLIGKVSGSSNLSIQIGLSRLKTVEKYEITPEVAAKAVAGGSQKIAAHIYPNFSDDALTNRDLTSRENYYYKCDASITKQDDGTYFITRDSKIFEELQH